MTLNVINFALTLIMMITFHKNFLGVLWKTLWISGTHWTNRKLFDFLPYNFVFEKYSLYLIILATVKQYYHPSQFGKHSSIFQFFLGNFKPIFVEVLKFAIFFSLLNGCCLFLVRSPIQCVSNFIWWHANFRTCTQQIKK